MIFLTSSHRDTHHCTVTRTYSSVQHTDRRQRLIECTDNGLRRRITKRFVAFYYNVDLNFKTEFAFPPPHPFFMLFIMKSHQLFSNLSQINEDYEYDCIPCQLNGLLAPARVEEVPCWSRISPAKYSSLNSLRKCPPPPPRILNFAGSARQVRFSYELT